MHVSLTEIKVAIVTSTGAMLGLISLEALTFYVTGVATGVVSTVIISRLYGRKRNKKRI